MRNLYNIKRKKHLDAFFKLPYSWFMLKVIESHKESYKIIYIIFILNILYIVYYYFYAILYAKKIQHKKAAFIIEAQWCKDFYHRDTEEFITETQSHGDTEEFITETQRHGGIYHRDTETQRDVITE